MKSRIAILIGCLALVALALYIHGARKGLNEQIAALSNRQVVRQEVKREVSPSPVTPTPEVAVPNARRPRMTLDELARYRPHLKALLLQEARATFRQQYAFLTQKLALNRDECDRFYSILERGIIRRNEVTLGALSEGLTFQHERVQALRQQAAEETEHELAEFLGKQRYETYTDFQRTGDVRGFVDGLAVQVVSTAPLSYLQAEELTRAMASASPAYTQGGAVNTLDIDWAAVDVAAARVLSPSQLAVWKEHTAQNRSGISIAELKLHKAIEESVKP
jgi:hypothetical protein